MPLTAPGHGQNRNAPGAAKKSGKALEAWAMFDVPVTISVKAPNASASEAYVRQFLDSSRFDLYTDGEAYKDDHAFVDGSARRCECVGH